MRERERVTMIQAGEIYDVGNDVDGEFSEEFKKYVHEENLVCWMRRIFVRGSISVFTKEHELDAVSFNHLASKIALTFESSFLHPDVCLVQFWRAEELEKSSFDSFVDRRFLLTTLNQPFLFANKFSIKNEISEGLYWYRMKTRDVIITGDGRGGGPISRVFMNKRMEATPNVAYYSYEEYPHRDLALSCLIKGSIIVPLWDSNGRSVGVIEFVSPHDMPPGFIDDLFRNWPYDSEKDLLRSEVSEINEVMEEVCESCDIVFAQTWILCKHCNSLFNSERCCLQLGASYWGCAEEEFVFLEVVSYCSLQKDEGIVGKAAASSHNLVYCKDIAKFSIAEYPMAHFARLYHLSACFAICLRSKHSVHSRTYVLEFFLDSSCVKGKDLRAILVPKLNVMRHKFRTFKMASGGELRDSLSIQVIDASFPDKFETLEIGALDSIDNHTTETSLIDNGENMVNMTEERDVAITLLDKQHDSSAISGDKRGGELPSGVSNAVFLQQVVHIDNFDISNGKNLIRDIDDRHVALASLGEQHNNAQISGNEQMREFDISTISQQPLVEENVVYTEANVLGNSGECIINSSKSSYRRSGIDISLEELMGVISMKRKDAAQRLNVSESTFKRVCRDYNILRWPPRKRNVEHPSSSNNSAQTASTKELGGIAPIVQNESLVTIKAKYGDKFIKFQLSASSGIDAFHHQVSKRLKLDARNYTVNYQDEENDWIIVACDDDLRDYISSSTLSGKNNLVISLAQI